MQILYGPYPQPTFLKGEAGLERQSGVAYVGIVWVLFMLDTPARAKLCLAAS